MKKIASIIFIAILLISLPMKGLNLKAHRGDVPDGYNFWLSKPADESTPKPVIIFLHGASLCGNNLDKVKHYGTIDAQEAGREIDAYVIAPQNPGGSWKPSKIKNVLDWVEANNNVDTTRVYVLGMSLGGYGTIDFTAAYPDVVAAALAMCGGGTAKNLGILNKVPLWIVHGTADNAVSVSKSDQIVAAIKEVDKDAPRLIYDRVPGMNHSQPARMFYKPEVYEWLFSHSLSEEGRPVHPAFKVNNEALSNVYKGLNMRRSRSTQTSTPKAKTTEPQSTKAKTTDKKQNSDTKKKPATETKKKQQQEQKPKSKKK